MRPVVSGSFTGSIHLLKYLYQARKVSGHVFVS